MKGRIKGLFASCFLMGLASMAWSQAGNAYLKLMVYPWEGEGMGSWSYTDTSITTW